MSLEELADRAGVRSDYVAMLELGKRTPPPSKWKTFANIFSITQVELLSCVCQIIKDELLLQPKVEQGLKRAAH
jgi:transcriptional regulator with XRE-family HTH domain